MKTLPQPEIVGDARLVELCLKQDREAFGAIVTRYQSLVCAVTYSACGDVGRSEDLAQDTFITAWKKLAELKEPARLKSWLCGIARNLAHNFLRREGRAVVEPLEGELRGPEVDPHEQAVSREEEALVWKALEAMPMEYREPMVLFYREGKSTQAVAEALELTEETVWQRLSRGRKMLKENVAGTVESALGRSVPGRAFTTAVMAALPTAFATPAKAAGVVTAAAKGGMVAKSVATIGWASWGVYLGNAFYTWKLRLEATKSPRERRFEIRHLWTMILSLLLWIGLCAGGFQYLKPHDGTGNDLLNRDLAFAAGFFGLAAFSVFKTARWDARKRRIQKEDGTFDPREWMPVSEGGAQQNRAMKGTRKWLRWALYGFVVFYAVKMAMDHHWATAACYWALTALFFYYSRRFEKNLPRFVPAQTLFTSQMILTVLMAIITLMSFNTHLAKGLLGLPVLGAAVVGFNAAVLLGYGVLWGFLVWRYRKFGGRAKIGLDA